MKKITILIPAYNEEEVLNQLYERISAVAANANKYSFEFLFISDGSKDNTIHILRELQKQDNRISFM